MITHIFLLGNPHGLSLGSVELSFDGSISNIQGEEKRLFIDFV